ncbi:uncharacterized protein LOC133891629 isoform X2 [Phragmites australis]|uniref:uncharacterized protein LOC133891629 isoform X2 n=1 Tax=Phragmites australis TaxID=29695 RepID=UPI002D7A0805|nr:uncharacterized protein LOC133891629 isoform X2 [Phragmites australis]
MAAPLTDILMIGAADYGLTGQLVWPDAVLMNNYLSEHPETVKGCSVIEFGSGIGITGILCSRFCKVAVLTDHNDEVLEIINKIIEMQSCANAAEKLEWGNHDHISNIIKKHPVGFDVVLGADIYILLNYFTVTIFSSDHLFYSSCHISTVHLVDLDSQKASSNLAFPVSLIL